MTAAFLILSVLFTASDSGAADSNQMVTDKAFRVLQIEMKEGGMAAYRVEAALILLPYSPDKIAPRILSELELNAGQINPELLENAVDSLTRYLSPSMLKRIRRILRNEPQTGWAVKLLCYAADPGDMELMERYFLSEIADPSLVPYLSYYGENAVELLERLMHRSREESCLAANQLSKMESDVHVDEMIRYGKYNLCLAWLLAFDYPEKGRQTMIDLLHSTDTETRRRTALSAGNLMDTSYLPHLSELLVDPDTITAINAAYSLGFLGDTSGAALLREITADTLSITAASVENLLSQLSPTLVVPVLYPFLVEDRGEPTRRAARAAGQLTDSAAVPLLVGLLESTDLMTQRTALDALGEIGDQSAGPYILPFLDSDSPQLKIGAILALGNMGYQPVVNRLNLMLFWEAYTEGAWMRHPVTDALIDIGDDDAVPALAVLLDDGDPYLYIKILDFFAAAASSDYIPYVEPLLDVDYAPIRIKAAATILTMDSNDPGITFTQF